MEDKGKVTLAEFAIFLSKLRDIKRTLKQIMRMMSIDGRAFDSQRIPQYQRINYYEVRNEVNRVYNSLCDITDDIEQGWSPYNVELINKMLKYIREKEGYGAE